MSQAYSAADIEVLSGLDPVRRRPGMYTDTTRPNHLAQEVIDNSVDEALAGHASRIDVVLHADDSISVRDDGRGMPVDRHPELGVPGVALILTRLHAGGKFGAGTYRFSGGLHGVGVSVVNALSQRLEVEILREGRRWTLACEHGEIVEPLADAGPAPGRRTGTYVRFWPAATYFDSPRIAPARLRHALKAKAVLCPGLIVTLSEEREERREQWCYEGGLVAYLAERLGEVESVPMPAFAGGERSEAGAVDYALCWLPHGDEPVVESYVNLIPTPLGGTHVNGLRTGLVEALREFCEVRGLLPRALRLAPEDVFDRLAYVLAVQLHEPQFAGQTKERLASREAAAQVAGQVKDAFALYLLQHTAEGEAIAMLAIERAQTRQRAARKVARKRVTAGPALPGKLADCVTTDPRRAELFLVEGDSAGGSARQARDREFQAIMPLRGKILNTWEVAPAEVLASQEVHDIAVALGVDPGVSGAEAEATLARLRYGKICILADADSDGRHIATLLCALFLRHFRPLIEHGHVFVAMPPLYRIDVGEAVHYVLDDGERERLLSQLSARDRKRAQLTRFKGLGEMSPTQLRETTLHPDTRRLVQLTLAESAAEPMLDMLLARKRAGDRRRWLERQGDRADVVG